MTDAEIRFRSQIKINDALKLYRGGMYVEPPKRKVYSDGYDDLTRQQIVQAVVALVLSLNLSGGSVGDADLYQLVTAYLWDDEARAKINAIVEASKCKNSNFGKVVSSAGPS